MVAFGYINESSTVGAQATLGLYSDLGGNPGSLIVSASKVVLKGSVQEVPVASTVLTPGTYYFTLLNQDGNEPQIYTALTGTIGWWIGGGDFASGLPASFGALAYETLSGPPLNVYIVVQQPGT
jgi:hypothetical protein